MLHFDFWVEIKGQQQLQCLYLQMDVFLLRAPSTTQKNLSDLPNLLREVQRINMPVGPFLYLLVFSSILRRYSF